MKASALTGDEFGNRLKYYASAWIPARDIVKDALLARGTIHTSKQIVLLERFTPWKASTDTINRPTFANYILCRNTFLSWKSPKK